MDEMKPPLPLRPHHDERGYFVLKPAVQPQQPQQDAKGRFVTGNTVGGRSKGSRNMLGEAMIADLYQDWKLHGIKAIRDVRTKDPGAYLKVVAMLVSKLDDAGNIPPVTVNVITRCPG